MTFTKNRNLLVGWAVLLFLAACGLLGAINLINIREVSMEMTGAAEQNVTAYIHDNVMTSLKESSTLLNQLDSPAFMSYSSSYANLLPASDAEAMRRDLAVRLKNLSLSPELYSTITFLGSNVNQAGFSLVVASGEWVSANSLPSIDDLKSAGLINTLLRNYGTPVYIAPGLLSSELAAAKPGLSFESYDRLNRLVQRIEGHIVINNGINFSNVLSLVILKDDFLKDIVAQQRENDRDLYMLTSGDNVIWRSEAAGSIKPGAIEAADNGNRGMYKRETISLTPFSLQLVVYQNNERQTAHQWALLVNSLKMLGIGLVISSTLAYYFSNRFLYPFRVLAKAARQAGKHTPLRTIPEESFEANRFSSISIRRKILLLLAVSVIVPGIFFSVSINRIMYAYTMDQSKEISLETSRQMVLKLRNKMNEYVTMTRQLSEDPQLTTYLYASSRQLTSGADVYVPSVSYYPSLYSISYFVLYDDIGNAKYSSIFSNNLPLFNDSRYSVENAPEGKVFWVSDAKDIYNRKAVKLVERFGPLSGSTWGNLQIVLKDEAFESINFDNRQSFLIMNGSNEVIYSSYTAQEPFKQAASGLAATNSAKTGGSVQSGVITINGSHQIRVAQPIPNTDWNLIVFHSIDDVLFKFYELLYRSAIVFIGVMLTIFVVMGHVSSRFVRSIMALHRSVDTRGQLSIVEEGGSKDEISELVVKFNEMVLQLNELTEQNVNNRLREQKLISMKTKAELAMLQQQINPHFLYNTLEAIHMRARQYGAEEVGTMVVSLAKLFRFSIDRGKEDDTVTLQEEINHVRNYMLIQSIRFKDKFSTNWELDSTVLDVRILRFILQPLVENAIQHGLNDYSSGGEINISAKHTDSALQLTVADNGIGMSAEQLDKVRQRLENTDDAADESESGQHEFKSGVGLRNVYLRLKLFYRDKVDFQIDSKEFEGTVITIRIRQ
jgi:two-component system, sensor histidine kinase YesM